MTFYYDQTGDYTGLSRAYRALGGSFTVTLTSSGTSLAITPRPLESPMGFLEYVARRASEQLGATFSAFRNVRGYATIGCSEAFTLSTSGDVSTKTGYSSGSTTFNNAIYASGLPTDYEFWPLLGKQTGSGTGSRAAEIRVHAGDMSFQGYDVMRGATRPTASGGQALPGQWQAGSATVVMLIDWKYARQWLASLLAESSTVRIVDLWAQDKIQGRFSVLSANVTKTGRTPTQMSLTINLVGHGIFDEVA